MSKSLLGHRMSLATLGVFATFIFAVAIAQAEEIVALGALDVAVTLPPGWTGTIERKEHEPANPGYNTQLKAKCETENCETSLDTCSLWVFDEVSRHRTARSVLDAGRDQYEFTRTALIHSGPDASVAKHIEFETLGKSRWYVVETRASGRYKSVLRAETIIEGRHLVAECRTCSRDYDRFDASRELLSSVVIGKDH